MTIVIEDMLTSIEPLGKGLLEIADFLGGVAAGIKTGEISREEAAAVLGDLATSILEVLGVE